MNTELLENLYDAYDYLDICNTYSDLISKFRRDTEECKNKYLRIKNEKISSLPAYFMVVAFGVVSLIFTGLISSLLNSYILVWLNLALIIAGFVFANSYIKQKRKEPEKNATEFWNTIGSSTCVSNNNNIEKLSKELEKFCEKNIQVLYFLPEDYRDDIGIIAFMIHNIKNGIADSIKECIHLYNEYKHRMEMKLEMQGLRNSIEMHNAEMEGYMSEISQEQRRANSRLANIETLTFLDYIDR